jgi:hypothetical protein
MFTFLFSTAWDKFSVKPESQLPTISYKEELFGNDIKLLEPRPEPTNKISNEELLKT